MGRDQLEKLWVSIRGLGARRLAALGFVGLAVLLAVGAATAYLSRPPMELLYSGLSRDDVGRIGTTLKDLGVAFDVSADGTAVSVEFGSAARARMLLAEKGLPQSADAGYELFDQIGSFGLTSFMQDVTRTRALEGELARSIQSMSGIKSARVHLVLPTRGSFRSDQQAASASVVVRTDNPGDASSAQAIRHLVAAAVPGLSVDNVTVLNTDGAVLASGDAIENASASKMAMIEQMVNREIEEKIRRTLTPYLGLGNFQVSVISQLNMDRTTTSETIFDPDSRVERSVRVIRENALTQNSSTAAATTVQQKLPDQATVTGDGGKNSNETNERREELTNYEVSSKTIETAKDGYTVEKLSIAVLVNKARLDATTADPTVGAADPSATTADPNAVPVGYQLMEIEQLIASAAGFSKERGDQLKVAAVPFAAEEITPEPEPGVVDLLVGQLGSFVNGLAAIVVALLVVLLGLRPAVKAIMARPALTASEAAMIAGPDAVDDGGRAGRPPDADGGNLIEDVTRKIDNSPRKRLEQIVDFDEEQAAAILRQWLHQDRVA